MVVECALGIPFGAAFGCLLAAAFCVVASWFNFGFISPTWGTILHVVAAAAFLVMIAGPVWRVDTRTFWVGIFFGMLVGLSVFVSEHAA
jgi:hypothetical protein